MWGRWEKQTQIFDIWDPITNQMTDCTQLLTSFGVM